MAGLGAGDGSPVHGAAWTGAVGIGCGGGFSDMVAVGTMVTLGGNAVGVSLGTLREGAGKFGWKTNAGEGCGSLRAGAFGGLAVTLEKMWESVWMTEN